MVKHVSQFFNIKKEQPEEKLITIIQKRNSKITLKNLHLHKGILWLKNIPSAYRVRLIFDKSSIIEEARAYGIHLRDIM